MALIKCPDCSTEVSDTAQKCLKCGKALGRTFLGKIINRIFICFNVGMAALMFLSVVITPAVVDNPSESGIEVAIFLMNTVGLGVFWGVGFCILFVLNFLTRP